MADGVYVRTAYGRQHAVRDPLGALPKAAMYRSRHEIEGGEHLVVIVKRAVLLYVKLDSRQDAKAVESGVDRGDLLTLRRHCRDRHAAGNHGRPGMIGHDHVAQATLLRRPRHPLNGVPAIAPNRMDVQVTAYVGNGNHIRQGTRLRSLDFSAVLAEDGRNLRQAEQAIEGGLRGRHDRLTLLINNKITVELPARGARQRQQATAVSVRSGCRPRGQRPNSTAGPQ